MAGRKVGDDVRRTCPVVVKLSVPERKELVLCSKVMKSSMSETIRLALRAWAECILNTGGVE